MSEETSILQYIPIKSFVRSTFWHKLAEIKIDIDKLSDAPKLIYGYYTNFNAIDSLIEVDYSAFNTEFKPPKYNFTAHGTLYNKNTIEDFKESDKTELLIVEGKKLLDDIKTGRILDNPNLLARFFILSFADLKTHKYYYWFGFPSSIIHNAKEAHKGSPLSVQLKKSFEDFYEKFQDDCQESFFILKKVMSGEDVTYSLNLLKNFIDKENLEKNFQYEILDEIYFCFADPSPFDKPAWFLRIYLTAIYYLCPVLRGKNINVISLRICSPKNFDKSLLWTVTVPKNVDESAVKFVGWEPNDAGKMVPRCASMGDTMDPAKLAENSVLLNLKLMKWRIMPKLDLDIMSNTKCLLFGAGTLGCAVARNLLAWGFKTLTFMDSGKVHYSNPVRQTLYKHEDAVNGHRHKATTAAERIQEINPSAISKGFRIQIPMPGHTIGESMRESVLKDVDTIIEAVKEHDVIFLLTDSRESRWLPTLLGAYYKKIVINAALGFDSYLIMRHGSHKKLSPDYQTENVDGLHCIPGTELGCYFCNDITAPGNSQKDRTLDQQCTVTRPGVSTIASSYAVELLVSILQHKDKDTAAAYYSTSPRAEITYPEGILGILPHSIRGMLASFDNILPATMKFSQCIACSEKVQDEYNARGIDFLFDVFASTKYLEDLTNLSQLKICENEIIECSDSDIEWSD